MGKAFFHSFLMMMLVSVFGIQLHAQPGMEQISGLPPAFIPRHALPHFFKKLKSGQPVSIVYLGGSITQAAGYRVKSADWLKKKYPKANIQAYNAGVGGTGSDLGVFRLKEDVLSHKPDLVFIEFAVNDLGTEVLRIWRAMEGIIRQVKSTNPNTEICLLYTISEPMITNYRAGKLPRSVKMMESLAQYYGLPSINFAPDVLKMEEKSKLIFRGVKGTGSVWKVLFTTDGTHPLDGGHDIYAATLRKAFDSMAAMRTVAPKNDRLPDPLNSGFYGETSKYSPTEFKLSSGWQKASDTGDMKGFLQSLPGLIYTEDKNDSLVLEFEGTGFGLEDVIGPASNGFSISVDGKAPFKLTRFDKYCSRYRRHYFLIDTLEAGKHRVVIRPDFSSIDKLSMLKPEDREVFDKAAYSSERMYVGSVLIIGKVVPGVWK